MHATKVKGGRKAFCVICVDFCPLKFMCCLNLSENNAKISPKILLHEALKGEILDSWTPKIFKIIVCSAEEQVIK